MKNFILLLLALTVFAFANAQQTKDGKDVSWKRIASDTSLTFQEVVTICDSLFANSPTIDTSEDGPSMKYNRWKQFWWNRIDARTGRPYDFQKGALQKIINGTNYNDCQRESPIQSGIGSEIPNGQGWHWMGPQNIARVEKINNKLGQALGRPTSVVVNPSNHNEIYIASEWGGIWKTTDAGAAPNNHWTCLTDNDPQISGIGVSHLAVDFSTTPHRLYFSLGYPAYFQYHYNGERTVGLFCSMDDGATFHVLDINSEVPDWKSNSIGDIRLYPGNTGSLKYLFVNTKYKVLRLDISDPTDFTPPAAVIKDITPLLSSYTDMGNRFRGFNDISFKPANPTTMYVTSKSNVGNGYSISANLYRIENCTGSTPTVTDITANLQYSSSNIILRGDFSTSPGFPWFVDTAWRWNNTGKYMRFVPTGVGKTACIEAAVYGSYAAPVPYTISFKVTLPPKTTVSVSLKDVSNPPGNTDCGGGPGWSTTVINYTNPTTAPVTYSYGPVVLTPSQYVNRIIFKGQADIGYTLDTIKLDDVKVEQVYFDFLNSTTTQAPGGGNNIYVDAVRYYNRAAFTQKSNDNGNSWTAKAINAWNYGAEVPGILRISPTDTNKAYYGFATCNSCLYSFNLGDASVPATYLNYQDSNHVDIRNLQILNISGNDILFVGNDGGLSKSTATSEKWKNLNGIGFDCSLPWDVASNSHNGNACIGVADNYVLNTNEANFKSWYMGDKYNDGAIVRYGKRFLTRQYQFCGFSSGGGTAGIRTYRVVDTMATSDLSVSGLPMSKLKTTNYGEYVGRNSGGYNIYSLVFSGTTPSWQPITNTLAGWPNEPVQAIAPDPSGPNFIAAFVHNSFWENGKFVVTNNGGSSWAVTDSSHSHITDLVTDPRPTVDDKRRVWASVGWYGNAGENRVLLSVNGTQTWADYSQGLPEGPVNVLFYDEQSRYLFAGTDMGVYARNVDDSSSGSSWQCYSLNLPNGFITGLDVNRCTGKIYASLMGRGAYSADLPQAWYWNDGDQWDINSITTHTTWTQDRDEARTIVIQPGASLTINNCTLSMARNKNIIVKEGATLIVDNATITNSCGAMWGSINVLGNPGVAQDLSHLSASIPYSNQGLVILKNNAVIENAYVGLFVGGSYYDGLDYPVYYSGKDGGLVRTDNATIRNCATGAIFHTYNKIQNSYFKNCTFLGDAHLQYGTYVDYSAPYPRPVGAWRGIVNIETRGLSITNTTFKVDLSHPDVFNPEADLRGTAYTGSNAQATIKDCTFENCTRGVYHQNLFGVNAPTVRNNIFQNNWRSISLCNAYGATAFANTIDIGPIVEYMTNDIGVPFGEPDYSPFGIYYSQQKSYNIKENRIGSSAGAWPSYGIILNATHDPALSGTAYNVLYRNSINDAYLGVAAMQDNRGSQISCNQLLSKTTGIYVTPSMGMQGRLSDQGNFSSTGIIKPAGNQFVTNPTAPACGSPIHIWSSTGNPPYDFRYYQHDNDPYRAVCVSNGAPGTVPVSMPVTLSITCSSYDACCPNSEGPIVIGTGATSLAAAKSLLHSADSTVQAVSYSLGTDKEAGWLALVANANYSSSRLTDSLLAYGSVLTDTVLLAALQRSPALDTTDARRLLLANSALSEPVWQVMAGRYPSLVQDQALVVAQATPSQRTILGLQQQAAGIEAEELVRVLTAYYLGNDSLETLAEFHSARGNYEEALGCYIMLGKKNDAQAMAGMLQDDDLRTLAGMYITYSFDGNRPDSISSRDSMALAAIAAQPYNHAGEMARLWLARAYDRNFPELMPQVPDTGRTGSRPGQAGGGSTENTAMANASGITAYPNPANQTITLQVPAGSFGPHSVVHVYNTGGLRMITLAPDAASDRVTIYTEGWTSGLYLAVVQQGDKQTNIRFVIKH